MVYKKLLTPAIVSFVVFLVYLHNVSCSVYGGDVGDLVTAAYVGGVAHPPGYPLFTLLGFLLTRFTLFPSPAFAVGLISVFAGAFSVFFFYLTIKRLTKSSYISLISTLILAFSYFFWFFSEIAEVFALNGFFFILLMYLAIKFYFEKSTKILLFLFFILGLSLTNHQTIVLTFPTLFLFTLPTIWKLYKEKKFHIKDAMCCVIAVLLGFLIYLYVPFASFHHPVLNWDNVKDIQSFLHLLLRQDYGTFSAGLFVVPSVMQRVILVKVYAMQVLTQLTIPVILLGLIGIFSLWKKYSLLTVSLLIGFLLTGPVFMGFAGFPLTGGFYFGVNERFFLLSTIFVLYFLPFGLLFVSHIFKKLSHVPVSVFQSVFLIIPLMLFFYNFPKTNLSTVFIGDYYGQDILTSLPKNALLFVAGDTIIFNTWYEHYVKNVRSDVHVLNISGNIASPYYATLEKQYKKNHPQVTSGQLQNGIVASLPQNGSVFSVEELQPTSEKKFTWIPYGLLFQLVQSQTIPTEKEFTQKEDAIWSQIHVPRVRDATNSLALGNVTIADIPNSYANAMLITGDYYYSEFKDAKKAKEWYDRALTVAPEYEKTYSSLGVYYLTIDKQCLLAKNNFAKAIDLNAVEPLNYFLLYATYAGCLHDKRGADAVKISFEKQFQTSFTKAFSQMKQGIQ